jgi:hypothetical protein
LATLAGTFVVQLSRVFYDRELAVGRTSAFLAAQLLLLTLAAGASTGRVRARPRPAVQRAARTTGVLARIAFVAVALATAHDSAIEIRNDSGLQWSGTFIVTVLVIVGMIVTGLAVPGAIGVIGRAPRLGPLAAVATGYRIPRMARLVVTSAMTVAIAAAILGASIEARPERLVTLDERLARLPALPANVALVRLDRTRSAEFLSLAPDPFLRSELTPELRARLKSSVPGAEIIELRHLELQSSPSFLCSEDCTPVPIVEANPRLRSIYGTDATLPVAENLSKASGGPLPAAPTSRVAPHRVLDEWYWAGKPLPRFSFTDAVFYEVPRGDVKHLGLDTKVRSVFIRSQKPLTKAQLARLRVIARTAPSAPGTRITVIGPSRKRDSARAAAARRSSHHSLRSAPWSATSLAARWFVAMAAAVLALFALFASTWVMSPIERRREALRLEQLGVTSRQARRAAALNAAVLFTVAAWFNVIVVTWLVRSGIHAFNRDEPPLAVPFRMPLPVLLALTVVLPALAALLAAFVTRPSDVVSEVESLQ